MMLRYDMSIVSRLHLSESYQQLLALGSIQTCPVQLHSQVTLKVVLNGSVVPVAGLSLRLSWVSHVGEAGASLRARMQESPGKEIGQLMA